MDEDEDIGVEAGPGEAVSLGVPSRHTVVEVLEGAPRVTVSIDQNEEGRTVVRIGGVIGGDSGDPDDGESGYRDLEAAAQ